MRTKDLIPEEFRGEWTSDWGRSLSTDGEVIVFDTRYFKVGYKTVEEFLQYIGDGTIDIVLPDNLKSIHEMFRNYKMPEGFKLGEHFNTKNVTDMRETFRDCEMCEGFRLNPEFDTSNVETMREMFSGCVICDGFELGPNFDTSNVMTMNNMFYACKMGENFSLGKKFHTDKVVRMDMMFAECEFCEGFEFPTEMVATSVENFSCMFASSRLPKVSVIHSNLYLDPTDLTEDMFDDVMIDGVAITPEEAAKLFLK